MNAVEIEEAITELAEQPFEADEFPYAFLEAFGNNATTIKKLRSGSMNKSDAGGVLQRNNIHIAVADTGNVTATLEALRDSPATAKAKAKFVLATDGQDFEAEDLISGETIACAYAEFPDHFGFFLPLAGITTVKQVRENSFDIRATKRLNQLYTTLLSDNPDWADAGRRETMNHFMARLIFCFFAEDTSIFEGTGLFTNTIEQMSTGDASNTDAVLAEIFRAMDLAIPDRDGADLPRWADKFPYVNGGLFAGTVEVPYFSKVARSYLIHIGNLDWTQINPDIFGSMIQAVADDEERGELGMHYTSVPNILKVLNPLFLDDLRQQLDAAGNNGRKLLNLRKRMARIRVFDPACGSGNFLVIAYREMREIENTINERRGEYERKTDIPLTNFRGIELRHFSAEISRLALVIAEYQCNVRYLGQIEALKVFLPLEDDNWVTCGNALRLDWLSICPPTGNSVRMASDDLLETPLDQSEIDFENEGGETYICGNPPYKGRNKKRSTEKSDTEHIFARYPGSFASLDYVANWFLKACGYCHTTTASAAFVATNSICQGEQVALLWPIIFAEGMRISFAHTSFKWSNLASYKAGVTVVIVGISSEPGSALLYADSEVRRVHGLGPYLVPNTSAVVKKREEPLSNIGVMYLGNMAKDGGHLIMSASEGRGLANRDDVQPSLVRKFFGSKEVINSKPRACLWIADDEVGGAIQNKEISERIEKVRAFRQESKAPSTQAYAKTPHRFVQLSAKNGERAVLIPRVSSENRPYLPVDYYKAGPIIGDKCYAIYDCGLWNFALIASKLHIVWIGTVCSRLEMRYSYGNKLGWNTFPVPTLTQQNKTDLTRCAENILLAREAHFPKTIADLYDKDTMPANLREAHDRNDEVLERIYIGRRFKNDTERLEKLFAMYTEMTGANQQAS